MSDPEEARKERVRVRKRAKHILDMKNPEWVANRNALKRVAWHNRMKDPSARARDRKRSKASTTRWTIKQKAIIADAPRLEAANKALAEALQFYATAWNMHPGDSGLGGNWPADPVCDPDADLLEDGGDHARKTLAEHAAKAQGGDDDT